MRTVADLYSFVAAMLCRTPYKIDHMAAQWASIAEKARTTQMDWESVFDIDFRTITRAQQAIISDREDLFFVQAILNHLAKVDESRTAHSEDFTS